MPVTSDEDAVGHFAVGKSPILIETKAFMSALTESWMN